MHRVFSFLGKQVGGLEKENTVLYYVRLQLFKLFLL